MSGLSPRNDYEKIPKELPDVDVIELKLIIWADGTEVKYMYSPTDKPKFFTKTKPPKLTLKIVQPPPGTSGEKPRFSFYSYTITGKKSVKKVASNTHNAMGPPHTDKGPKPHFFDLDTGLLEFELDLILNTKETSYINILVWDDFAKEIIGCDPQVENTSTTGTFILTADESSFWNQSLELGSLNSDTDS